jgi:hypothetical protein
MCALQQFILDRAATRKFKLHSTFESKAIPMSNLSGEIQDTGKTLAILVASCDRYSDLWPIFFRLFRRFWPDCPFPVYLLSNNLEAQFPGVVNVRVGDDISWSDNLLAALPGVNADYIFLFIDDLLICERVNTAAVCDVLKDFVRQNGNYIRLNPAPRPDRPLDHLIGSVSAGTLYRTATVLSVWKKEILFDLLKKGETPWEFEIDGSIRSDAYSGFFSTHTRILSILNAVIKGKWERGAIRRLRSLAVGLELGVRPVMTRTEKLRLEFHRIRNWTLNRLPPESRRRVKNLFSGARRNPVSSARA